MTQKNIWNISVKELLEKYQVTEQGLTTARAAVSYTHLDVYKRQLL